VPFTDIRRARHLWLSSLECRGSFASSLVSASHAARCTARHSVDCQADPPMIEWA